MAIFESGVHLFQGPSFLDIHGIRSQWMVGCGGSPPRFPFHPSPRYQIFPPHPALSENSGNTPKWMMKMMENPIKHGIIWGYHYFRKHPYMTCDRFSGNLVVFGRLLGYFWKVFKVPKKCRNLSNIDLHRSGNWGVWWWKKKQGSSNRRSWWSEAYLADCWIKPQPAALQELSA